jgi:hypothetical protein
LKLRHPFETIYTYGERYRALENEMDNGSSSRTKHDEVEMVRYYAHGKYMLFGFYMVLVAD